MKSLHQPQVRGEILRRLANVRSDTPRLWGRMTAPQMICHLNDAFLGVMGDRPVALPTGFSFWPYLKWMVLYMPMKWPAGVPTRPEVDQFIGGTPPSQFDRDMSSLLASIDKFTGQPRTFRFVPHPMFKVMSESEWMRWAYLHTDHHLRQFGQ